MERLDFEAGLVVPTLLEPLGQKLLARWLGTRDVGSTTNVGVTPSVSSTSPPFLFLDSDVSCSNVEKMILALALYLALREESGGFAHAAEFTWSTRFAGAYVGIRGIGQTHAAITDLRHAGVLVPTRSELRSPRLRPLPFYRIA